MTAVEWLINELNKLETEKYLYKTIDYRIKKQNFIEQAKEMEKEQMKYMPSDEESVNSYCAMLGGDEDDINGQAMPLQMPTESKAIPVLSDDIVDTNKM